MLITILTTSKKGGSKIDLKLILLSGNRHEIREAQERQMKPEIGLRLLGVMPTSIAEHLLRLQ